ncbi:LamG domain-containing protein [Algibacillus agarilyticus]|uniref:LamG domain-containing protein n=1 Tax=Algibacillus agarilyticus TaxID=2234133 RepID=UPI000DD07490|nr:LamG domain-containing protein [Algibacillus agarilyticus]
MFKTIKLNLSLLIGLLCLVSCGESEVESIPPVQEDEVATEYTGPGPQTEDIQKFKTALWDNISALDKCGACHTEGLQAPYFASRENVNDAYAVSNTLVTLSKPADSRLVTKVANGHNCWLGSDQACGETMTQWIKIWADDRVSVANTIEFKPPTLREAGASKTIPTDSTLFAEHIYPIVQDHCADCHNQSAQFSQSPFFASDDVDEAYQAATRVMNIDDPALSRLVMRLRNEFHNCWSISCTQDGNEMFAAISAFSENISIDEIADDLVVSKALRLNDGVVASAGGRFESDIIALYQFKTGSGSVAYDTSGISPAANLNLSGNIEWLGSWGIQINNGKAQASTATSKKIHDLILSTNEFTLEAWLTPGNVVQEGPARIITYSAGDNDRNFTLGQTQYNYDFMLRTQNSSTNGQPALSTPDADEVLQATLQHVVLTYNAQEGRKLYVNGNLIDVNDDEVSPLALWDNSFALILGNEASNNHQWRGSIRLLALFNRTLTPEQIQQNYDVGVGEKFFLLFSITDLVNTPNTYIVFEVSQYDNYSYLFAEPSLINLDGLTLNQTTALRGMRLGINGKESTISQAFANLDISINSDTSLSEPQLLSRLGTLISMEKGVTDDEFFLTFDQLGDKQFTRVEGIFTQTLPSPSSSRSPQIGIRNFAEINATMSKLTGVAANTPKVFDTFQLVQRQLPSIENVETFISAQQMAVTQLGIAYCDAVIENTTLRSNWFPLTNFNALPHVAFATNTERLDFITPLVEQLTPLSVSTQPDKQIVTDELNQLIQRLSICDGSCPIDRSKTIAKSSCAALLASAVTLLQ